MLDLLSGFEVSFPFIMDNDGNDNEQVVAIRVEGVPQAIVVVLSAPAIIVAAVVATGLIVAVRV